MHRTDTTRTWTVGELTRVEGEGALHAVVDGDEVAQVHLEIFEPPRFFEALLRGRHYAEVTDITARICGICPVAYQTSSANAMEAALGLPVSREIGDLRRLLYLGEWIESHALHVYLLHAPDFLGYPGGIELAQDAPAVVSRGLRLKRAGNRVMSLVGGREIHPISPRVGGFWAAPDRRTVTELIPELEQALLDAEETLDWVATFDFPEAHFEYEYVALWDPDEYAVIDGRIRSNRGIDIAPAEWDEVFTEEQAPWSNALHARVRDRGAYHVGPMARFELGFEQLHPRARTAASRVRVAPPVTNPFQSIVIRAIELVHASATALDLMHAYRPPSPPYLEAPPRAATGHGVSEAPRGLLYHRYRLDAEGLIQDAQIVPPTSQNQLRIETDLEQLIPPLLDRSDEEIQHLLEQAIRNYDPCISCATHFLRLNLERR